MEDNKLITDATDEQMAGFGRAFLERYLAWGFQSLSKKDIELLIYFALEDQWIVDRYAGNYAVARKLHLTQQRVAALRRESYARWATDAERNALLERSLVAYFSEGNIEGVLESVRADHLREGFLPILLEHPVERAEFEQSLKLRHVVPRYTRNKEVMLVKFGALLGVLEDREIIPIDKKLVGRIHAAFDKNTDLKGFLKTDIRKLSLTKARSAMNDAVAGAVSKLAEESVGNVAKLIATVGPALFG